MDAEAAGLVRLGPEGARFRHPLVRSGIYRSASPDDRRAAHRALAEVALARGADGAHAAARHNAAAATGPDENVAAALAAAGRAAASRLGYAEAASLVARAAELTPDGDMRAPRLLEAGSLATLAGQSDLARTALDRAISEARDPQLGSAARGARAHLEMWTGNVIRARQMLTDEAMRIFDAAPQAAATLLLDAALAAEIAGDVRPAPPGAPPPVVPGALPPGVHLAAARAVTAVLCGEIDAQRNGSRRSETRSAITWEAARSTSPVPASGRPRSPGAEPRSSAALAGAARTPGASCPARRAPLPLASLAERWLSGDWPGAVAIGQAAAELADEIGMVGAAALARTHLTRLFATRGEAGHCHALSESVMATVHANGSHSLVVYMHAALGLLELSLGRFEAALRELTVADDRARAVDLRSHTVVPFLPDLIEAAVSVDRRDLAERAFERLLELDPAGFLRTRAAVARCRGLLEQDHGAAIEHLSAAIELEDRAGVPFEAARSRLLLGERLLHTRTRREALAPLERAFATFDALEARPWADRAANGLGTLRARPRRSGTSTADLTPQELQVAHAATEGLTNKQIAAHLFLSVKTVEFHLRNAYGKLGVRSRTQLAAQLRGPDR
ncbi:MAG: hypothetical protein H6531_10490 [Actinobacteria bacterium]|nr:hypothetical protein [Actinomycetota bacterium]